ncbi:Tetraacyldisaccharide 4'-kinase [Phytophthora palmivora]|uniref:tetraacyldisaccharide 4'-kinase n=1 Tax=Phytophthora palmivora TaxID=4796 RepID=A0A2P4YNN9_9STRA|nr:Tetraacyldisaccharide 4'-kinase [Phytophthora palmivora]
MARADVVIVHHANLMDGEELKTLMKCLRMLMNWQRRPVIATSQMKVMGLIPADRLLSSDNRGITLESMPSLRGRLALVVCGVGNPDSVAKVVEKLDCWVRVELKAFPDHHAFNSGDIHDILDWRNEDVVVVTTEKDFARSSRAMEALAEEVDLRILKCELELLYNADQVKERM